MTSIKNINDPVLNCDIIYSKYGNRYGFNSSDLKNKLKKGNVILITNDKQTIENLKNLFSKKVVVIYIVSDINARLLRQIYMKRHGFPSFMSIQSHISDQLEESKKMLFNDNSECFIECIERINKLIDSIIMEQDEFKLRLDSIKHQDELYSDNFFNYDYVVMNLYSNNISTIHATKSAFEQLKKIIRKETKAKL